jgi:hypothetical protein
MINPDELEICRRRGHALSTLGQDWNKCKSCGMWIRDIYIRDVYAVEEREDEPPADEQDLIGKMMRERVLSEGCED